jgi:putative ATP-binding cassette transporter
VNSAGIIYLALKENKKSAVITFASSITYVALSYYELISQAKIFEDWQSYGKVFAGFASTANNTQSCSVVPINFEETVKTCLPVEGELYHSLSKGKMALATYIALSFSKPLLLTCATHALSFSLSSALIKKWLKSDNNQLGLKMLDNEIAMETREIVYDYSDIIVSCVIERLSTVMDIATTVAKMYNIYEITKELEAQDADFNLLRFITLALSTFFIANFFLNVISKKYTDSVLKKQTSLKNNLTFNMDNALQVECSRATVHEFNLLNTSLLGVAKAQGIKDLLSTSTSIMSMMFTHFFSFAMLEFSIPTLAKNPNFYFEIERLGKLITELSIQLWSIFAKISHSLQLHYASTKVKKFIDLIDAYQALLANRKDFKMSVDAQANLSCNLTIRYPLNVSDNRLSYKVLLDNFKKEFVAGKLYAISGPSGSGKTSFFNALIGINPYATGHVTIPPQENIIYVPQKPVFKQNLNWMQTVLYPLKESHFDLELEQYILKWVHALGLESTYHDSKTSPGWINNLSGGEAQRLALIQALAKALLHRKKSNDKILLLLDEAMNALDPEIQEKTFGLIRKQVEEQHIIAIHIDHSDRRIIKERYEKDCIIYFDALNKKEK